MLSSLIGRVAFVLALTLAVIAPVTQAASALYAESPQALVDLIHAIDEPIPGNPDGELRGATAAYFGASFYQSLISGNLVLASEGKMSDNSSAAYGCGETTAAQFDVESNPRWKKLVEQGQPSIVLLVKRGALQTWLSCPFDRKVLNAQTAFRGGVVAVLVYDPTEESNIRMIDRGLGSQINIPSFFLNDRYKDPTDATKNVLEHFVEITPLAQAWYTEMSLEFYLPNPDGRVEVEYWFNVADDDAVPFLTTFGTAGRELVGKMLIQPKPYFFLNADCESSPQSTPCVQNCLATSGGSDTKYYCSPRQSSPSKFGNVNGTWIVREALRQMCMYNDFTKDDKGQTNRDNVWMWSYWEMFYQFEITRPNPLFPSDWSDVEETRVKRIWNNMRLMGLPSKYTYDRIAQCMEVARTVEPDIFTKMLKAWTDLGPVKRLSVYINEQEYYGTPRCPTPLTHATCGILSGICYGYANSTAPAACLSNQNCPFGQATCGDTNIDNSVLGMSAGGVVGVVIAFLIVTGVLVWLYLRYYKQRMRADVDVLLQQYLPMDPGATHGSRNLSHVREAQEKRLISDIDLEDQALETRGL